MEKTLDARLLKNETRRKVQLKLLEHHVEPSAARSLAQGELRHWSPDRLDSILRKAPTAHANLRHFAEDTTSIGHQPLAGASWVCAPPALIERAAGEKLALCVNAKEQWRLCSEGYVAISHVWIEGIQADPGNLGLSKPILNSIFAELKPLDVSWIWLDCLAIPGGHRTLTAEQEIWKKDIINNLANTYLKADAVVIFDARVMRLQSLDLVEVAVVLLCGRWMTRLWTLQEVYLAGNGVVMTAWGPVKFKEIVRALCYLSENQQEHEQIVGPLDSHLLQMIKDDVSVPLFDDMFLRLVRISRAARGAPSLTQLALSCYERQTGNDIDYARAFFPLLGLEWKVQNSREEGMKQIYESQMYYSMRLVLMHGSPRCTFRPGWAPSYLTGLTGPILSPNDPLGDIRCTKRGLDRKWYTHKITNHQESNETNLMILSIQSTEKDEVMAACKIEASETPISRNNFFNAITQGQAFLLSNEELVFPETRGSSINCILVERDVDIEFMDEAWVCFTSEVLAMQGKATPEVHSWLLLHESPVPTQWDGGKWHSGVARILLDETSSNHSEAPLLMAMQKGDFLQFQRLLAADVNLNVTDGRGCTPLHLAILLGHIGMVDALLDRNISVNVQTGRGRTPLHIAVDKGMVEVVQKLLARGADPNLHDTSGKSIAPGILHQAVLGKHYQIMRLLIDHGAAIDKKDFLGYPLSYAFQDFEAASILLDAGADPNTNFVGNVQLIHSAARIGQTQIVEMLLDRGIDVDRREGAENRNSTRSTALYRAVEEQRESTVSLLIGRGADANLLFEDDWTCTLMAARSGNVNILASMLSHRPLRFRDACRPQGWTALHLSAEAGHRIPTKMLLEAGWDYTLVDVEGRTAAALAYERGHVSVVQNIQDFLMRALNGSSL